MLYDLYFAHGGLTGDRDLERTSESTGISAPNADRALIKLVQKMCEPSCGPLTAIVVERRDDGELPKAVIRHAIPAENAPFISVIEVVR